MSSNIITAQRFGKLLIWAWRRYIKKSPVKYKELDLHYSNCFFIVIGCCFFAIVVGLTLLYSYYIVHH